MKNTLRSLFFVGMTAASFAAGAVGVYVDGRNGNDNWDGSCAYADRDEAAKKGPLKTFSKFKDKYNKIDDVTVYVAPDTYYSATPFSYWGKTWLKATLIGTGTADDPVIFDGQSTGVSLPFNQPYRSVRLENLVLRNGRSNGGGAALSSTGLVLLSATNCVFESCTNPRGTDYTGGALSFNQAQPPEFVGCSFTNCSSVGNGGAIYLGAVTTDVRFVNTSFTDCVSSNGAAGAVYIAMADGELTTHGIVLEGCGFTNNAAPTGGALASPVKLCKDTTFVGNRATGSGGAFYYNGYTGKHGGLWPMTNVFVSCTFTNNAAKTGGALSWDKNKRFVFRDCTFVGNVGKTRGAVFGTNEAIYDFVVDGCRVERNSGNGIFNIQPGVSTTSPWGIRISNCVFADNDAGEGDLLLMTKATDRIENCAFLRNIGRWVYQAGSHTGNTNYLANCLFACNTNRCSGSSGIAYIEWQGTPRTSIYNVTFVSNAAPAAPYVIHSNHTGYGPKVFANVVTFGNRGLNGEMGDPYNSGIRSGISYSFFETGTASVPANRHNVVADDPRFIGGTFEPAPGSPIRRSGLVETWMEEATDLNGAPRLNDNGTVAMGCYRYQFPGLLLFVK